MAGANGHWRIRPTLYTELLEYTTDGVKNLVLQYHVDNAAEKDFDEIHDWERVEIVLRGGHRHAGRGGDLRPRHDHSPAHAHACPC